MQYYLRVKQGGARTVDVKPAEQSFDRATKPSDLSAWLKTAIPHLDDHVLRRYADILRELGYDHVSTLPHVQLEDLAAIPKGHARVIVSAAKKALDPS